MSGTIAPRVLDTACRGLDKLLLAMSIKVFPAAAIERAFLFVPVSLVIPRSSNEPPILSSVRAAFALSRNARILAAILPPTPIAEPAKPEVSLPASRAACPLSNCE